MNDIKVVNDIKVIEGDNPKKLKIGWCIYEENGPHYLPSISTECYECEEADKYKSRSGIKPRNEKMSYGYTDISVLEFLWGQPWNNLALNYVMGLRPSAIRVVDYSGGVTLDCCRNRITVFLEKDNRTIREIEQEVEVNLIGCDNGQDLELKFRQQKTGKKIEPFDCTRCIIDDSTIAKINILKDQNDKK